MRELDLQSWVRQVFISEGKDDEVCPRGLLAGSCCMDAREQNPTENNNCRQHQDNLSDMDVVRGMY